MARRTINLGDHAGFTIALEQHGIDNFAVRYGQQLDGPGLNYADAAAKLGQAFMHALACEGKIDNRERGERDESEKSAATIKKATREVYRDEGIIPAMKFYRAAMWRGGAGVDPGLKDSLDTIRGWGMARKKKHA